MARALCFVHIAAKHTKEEVHALNLIYLDNLRQQPLSVGVDWATNDVASDEIVQNVKRVLAGVEALLAKVDDPKP